MNNNSDFANRLKELRIKSMETQASMAKKCGVSTRMWIKYEQGLSIPGGEVFLTLAAQGMDMEYLLTGITLSEDDALTVYLPPKEQELIKYYRQATDKNQEIILTLAKMVEKKPVWLRSWLQRHVPVDFAQLSIISVKGDSMEGVLNDHDTILVNHTLQSPADGVYVIRMGNDLFVKRTQVLPHNRLKILSENPSYQPFEVDLNEQDLDFQVIGRVEAFFRKL